MAWAPSSPNWMVYKKKIQVYEFTADGSCSIRKMLIRCKGEKKETLWTWIDEGLFFGSRAYGPDKPFFLIFWSDEVV